MAREIDLLDERSDPDGFRARFGRLASASSEIDVAVTRVRLSLVDLRPGELAGVLRLRVLVSHLNAIRLAMEAEAVLADARRATNVRLLMDLLGQGRILVRSAPMGGWAPDFTVFWRDGNPQDLLVGVHSFQRPSPFPGPLHVSHHGPEGARSAARRFRELWKHAHDVSEPIRGLLEGVDRLGAGAPETDVLDLRPEPVEREQDRIPAPPRTEVDTDRRP